MEQRYNPPAQNGRTQEVLMIARIAGVTALALALPALPGQVDEAMNARKSPSSYRVHNLSSLGGSDASGNGINDQSLVAGYSTVEGDTARHATLWLYGFEFDLGTLGGPNSNVAWPVKNTQGLIAGIAQTDIPEPLGETWSCRAFFAPATSTGYICLAVVWENGEIRALPTLGGFNGFATGANNKRRIVGWAENTVDDPTCVPPQRRQFRAVLWGPGENDKRELPPLRADSTSAATAINDKGQVVGISGACGTAVGGVSARHAVMWEKGRVKEIGDLGGVAWNTPMAINERGEVVGFSNISAEDGDAFNAQAFLWTKEKGIRGLGTLPGDSMSQALGINERGQIVGLSCTAGFESCRAFLWEKGVMYDLNDLVEPGYADHLYTANDINDAGEITGQAVDGETQANVAFWAVPTKPHKKSSGSSARSHAATPLPAAVRQELLQQLGLSEARFLR